MRNRKIVTVTGGLHGNQGVIFAFVDTVGYNLLSCEKEGLL